MVTSVRLGATARVTVPGSSANLGPGFDSLGLALAIRDSVQVEALPPGRLEIEVSGAAAADVPRDESHLVVRALRAALDAAGAEQPGLRLQCTNTVPHGRGIGSSAAAIVSGVIAARGLLDDPARLDDELALQVATDFEGHPDNAAASLFGGVVLGWMAPRARAVTLSPHDQLGAVVAVPGVELSTARARAMLPAEVPHADAAFVAGRAALLVEALTRRPELLHDATEDRLHQEYRRPAMPATMALLDACRAAGVAATVSGAGPSLLVLGTSTTLRTDVEAVAQALHPGGWDVREPGIDTAGARLESADV